MRHTFEIQNVQLNVDKSLTVIRIILFYIIFNTQ